MADKNERPEVYENKNGEEDRRVLVYQNGDRYFGRICRISDNKVILEWDFDAYVCLDNYFLYLIGDDWFCFELKTEADTVYLGCRLTETFYVRQNEDGTVHYAYFNYDGDYCLSEGNALRVEEAYSCSFNEEFILVFEKTNFCKAFYLSPWGIWIDPVYFFSFMRECGGYLSVEVGEENTPYGLFYNERDKGYHILHKGKDLCRFYNAFVGEEGNKFVLYVYDGKELVVAEAVNSFFQNHQGIVLDDKFWACRKDIPDLLNPEVKGLEAVPKELAEMMRKKQPVNIDSPEPELPEPEKVFAGEAPKMGIFRRLWLWLTGQG